MISIVGNQLLKKMEWSDNVQRNINTLVLRPAVIYFQTERSKLIIYMEINLLLNSINKGS